MGNPVTAIELTLPDPGDTFLSLLERVTARTGWQLVGPEPQKSDRMLGHD